MKAFLVSVAVATGVALAASAVVISLITSLFHFTTEKGYIEMLERVSAYDRERSDYLFEGANKRGLLDICERASDQKVVVLFKEDCATEKENAK